MKLRKFGTFLEGKGSTPRRGEKGNTTVRMSEKNHRESYY